MDTVTSADVFNENYITDFFESSVEFKLYTPDNEPEFNDLLRNFITLETKTLNDSKQYYRLLYIQFGGHYPVFIVTDWDINEKLLKFDGPPHSLTAYRLREEDGFSNMIPDDTTRHRLCLTSKTIDRQFCIDSLFYDYLRLYRRIYSKGLWVEKNEINYSSYPLIVYESQDKLLERARRIQISLKKDTVLSWLPNVEKVDVVLGIYDKGLDKLILDRDYIQRIDYYVDLNDINDMNGITTRLPRQVDYR